MPGVLLDLRTGDPILEDGDYIQIENDYAFYQIINNLLNCEVGSEVWNIYYGFSLMDAVRVNSSGAPVEILKSLLSDALDPKKEKLIYAINAIEAWRDGQQAHLKFSLQSKFGTTIELEETIET